MNKGGQRDQLTMQQPTGFTGPPDKDIQSPLHPSQLLDNRTKNRRKMNEAEQRGSIIPEEIETTQQYAEEKKSLPINESPGSVIKLELYLLSSYD